MLTNYNADLLDLVLPFSNAQFGQYIQCLELMLHLGNKKQGSNILCNVLQCPCIVTKMLYSSQKCNS